MKHTRPLTSARLRAAVRPAAVAAAVLAAVAVCTPVAAQDGRSAYSFLEIPSSAHATALGGSGIAVIDDDVTLSQDNPALIGPELNRQVALSYMHYFGSSNFAGVRYGMPAGEHGAWAAGIRYLDYGKMTYADPDGTVGGEFSAQDIVAEGTYSHDFTDCLRGGINLKMAYSHYEEYSAFAMGVDLGINYYNPEKDLSLSLVVKNAGGQIKRFNEAYDRLPFDVQIGYMQGLGSSPFSIAITAGHLTKWKLPYIRYDRENPDGELVRQSSFFSNLFRHLIFGLQYAPSDRFYIGIGYNNKTRTDMSSYKRSILSGWSAGFGLKVKSFRIGASYSQPHKGASTILLNVSLDAGELLGYGGGYGNDYD